MFLNKIKRNLLKNNDLLIQWKLTQVITIMSGCKDISKILKKSMKKCEKLKSYVKRRRKNLEFFSFALSRFFHTFFKKKAKIVQNSTMLSFCISCTLIFN